MTLRFQPRRKQCWQWYPYGLFE